MNRTLKEATVRRYHYETNRQLQDHLAAFLDAYNFAKRLKTLRGLTPYEAICRAWAAEPERFSHEPVRLTSGLNSQLRRQADGDRPEIVDDPVLGNTAATAANGGEFPEQLARVDPRLLVGRIGVQPMDEPPHLAVRERREQHPPHARGGERALHSDLIWCAIASGCFNT